MSRKMVLLVAAALMVASAGLASAQSCNPAEDPTCDPSQPPANGGGGNGNVGPAPAPAPVVEPAPQFLTFTDTSVVIDYSALSFPEPVPKLEGTTVVPLDLPVAVF